MLSPAMTKSPFATLLTQAVRSSKLVLKPTPAEFDTPKSAEPARLSVAVRKLLAETSTEELKDRERILSPSARHMPTGFKSRSAIVGVCENVDIYGRQKPSHWSYKPEEAEEVSEVKWIPTKVLRIRKAIAKRKARQEAKAVKAAPKAKTVKKAVKAVKPAPKKKAVKKAAKKITRNRK